MNIFGKQNLGTSPGKSSARRQATISKSMLTPKISENSKQTPEQRQLSAEDINISILQRQLIRVRELFQNQQNQKWRILHEKNAIENEMKIFGAERGNALGENQKLRNQIKILIGKTDQLNSEKTGFLNEAHQLRNEERVMKMKIQNLEQTLDRERKMRQTYCSQALDAKVLERRIAQLDLQNSTLRTQNKELVQNLSRLQIQYKTTQSLTNNTKSLEERINKLSNENKSLKQQMKMVKHEVEIQKKLFLDEKHKLLKKSAQLEEYVKVQRAQFQKTSTKLKEISTISENQNKKLFMSVSTDLSSSLTFGKASEDRQFDSLKEDCYQKQMRINHLSREVLDLQRIIKQIQHVNAYNQHSSDSNTFSALKLRDCFKSSTTSMTPRQFNLYNEIQAKRLRIEQLQNQNKMLSEKLQQQPV